MNAVALISMCRITVSKVEPERQRDRRRQADRVLRRRLARPTWQAEPPAIAERPGRRQLEPVVLEDAEVAVVEPAGDGRPADQAGDQDQPPDPLSGRPREGKPVQKSTPRCES